MALVDAARLDELPTHALPVSVRSRDLATDARSPRQRIVDTVKREGIEAPIGRVMALLQPRSFGFFFNPVVFYFCFGRPENRAASAAHGAPVALESAVVAIVADIHNTPWGERFCYVIPAEGSPGDTVAAVFRKRFHVSPFAEMDATYRWQFRLDDEGATVDMALDGPGTTFDSRLSLRWAEADRGAWRRLALAYPLQGFATLLRIYVNAFRLWRKGAKFHPHPNTRSEVDAAFSGCPCRPRGRKVRRDRWRR